MDNDGWTTSVCIVVGDINRIDRLSDVKEGQIVQLNSGAEKKLFWGKGEPPLSTGSLGVWKWTTEPNKDDPSKQWVVSSRQKGVLPFEVVFDFRQQDRSGLARMLLDGISLPAVDRRRLVLFWDNGQTRSVLCEPSMLEVCPKGMKLQKGLYALPVYDVKKDDCILTKTLSDESIFLYRYLTLPKLQGHLLLFPLIDLIKKQLLDRLTRNFVLENGGTRNERKRLSYMLSRIPTSSLIEEVATTCGCSQREVKASLDEFLGHVNKYVSCEDIESRVLKGLLAADELVQSKLKEIWLAENNSLLEKEKKQLDDSRAQYAKQKDELQHKQQILELKLSDAQREQQLALEGLQREISAAQVRCDMAKKEAEHYEELGRNGLQSVRERLSLARKEASEFLADLALFSAVENTPKQETPPNNGDSGGGTRIRGQFIPGAYPSFSIPVNTWDDSLEGLLHNLELAGIGKEYRQAMGIFLYAAFCTKTALLLAGPLGNYIADALSCALTGRHGAVLDCYGEWNPAIVKEIACSDDELIIVKNSFQGRWIDHLLPEVVTTDKVFVFVHPYAEDLSLEAGGLFQYVLPLITNFFAEKRPESDFGCYRKNEPYESRTENRTVSTPSLVKKMSLSRYLDKTVGKVFSLAQMIAKDSAAVAITLEYFCILFPLAVALNRKDIFMEKVREETALSQDDKKNFERYFGEAE